jgi:Fur family ferric uptake transcriptional regulator
MPKSVPSPLAGLDGSGHDRCRFLKCARMTVWIGVKQEVRMETQDLRRAGLKVTHPRMRILEILEASDGKHMTAEDIYRKLLEHQDDIGLATVYRVLTQFESAGLVVKHNFESGQAVYEIDRGKHHDHMVDIESGRIIEFVSEDIEKLQREIAERHGYVIEEHSLVLYVRPKKKR